MAYDDPITWNPALPTVMHMGDSISIGCHPRIAQRLNGTANYWRPLYNCGHVLNHLTYTPRWWWPGSRPSLVCINAGMWDVVTSYGIDESTYTAAVEIILEWWQERMPKGCVLLWANTTYVGPAAAAPGRTDANVQTYNAAAAGVCSSLSVPVLDLHTPSAANYPDWYYGSGLEDDVHLATAGFTALADIIVDDWAERLGWNV